jgi:hypothetical protein
MTDQSNSPNHTGIVPLQINQDYTYLCDRNLNHVDLTVILGPYTGLSVRVPADGMEFAAADKDLSEFQYQYTVTQVWDQIDEEKVAGTALSLDSQDQMFLHSLVFSFYHNIGQGQIQGLSIVPDLG